MSEQIILVDKNDKQIGIGEKMAVHRKGQLHQAFSVFVFNKQGELMIQQRAKNKYHCPGLWANTCCSHPRLNEPTDQAAHRRLKEEMGFDCPLKEVGQFIYKTKFDNGLYEHEYNHVFVGQFNSQPKINPEEVADWKWVKMEKLKKDIKVNAKKYTYWFRVALDKEFFQDL
jgi:isopentenyl-diphosphate delta-isomerase